MKEILVLWVSLNIAVLIVLLSFCANGANCSFVNPKVIYNNLKVN